MPVGGRWFAGSSNMKPANYTTPEIAFISATRVALGSGMALLVAERLNKDQRKGAGWVLLGIGIVSSVPILVSFLRKRTLTDKLMALAS